MTDLPHLERYPLYGRRNRRLNLYDGTIIEGSSLSPVRFAKFGHDGLGPCVPLCTISATLGTGSQNVENMVSASQYVLPEICHLLLRLRCTTVASSPFLYMQNAVMLPVARMCSGPFRHGYAILQLVGSVRSVPSLLLTMYTSITFSPSANTSASTRRPR